RTRLRRLAAWVVLDLLLAASLLVISAWADTSGSLRQVQVGGCYCGCAQSKTAAGCTKMCELPKYASRWWAVSCAKPRASAPAGSPEARPRLAHPDRPERASN
ncbi:MAG TPA: hypothetical protein VGI13_10820, partial [Candidatus Acidoferrum sp.]